MSSTSSPRSPLTPPAALLLLLLPTASAASLAAPAALDGLKNWLSSKDVSTATTTGGVVDGFGNSLVAARDVEAGERLLAVPRRLHLAASSSPVASRFEALEDESSLLALRLLHEVGRGEASEWAPYLAILPTAAELNVPLLWSEEERARLLAGSHLQGIVDQLSGELGEQWQALDASTFAADRDTFPADAFSRERFLWAHAICLSRALPFGDELSLIPLLDLANHEAGAVNPCSIATQKADGSDGGAVTEAWQLDELGGEPLAVLTAGKAHGAGEQVFIDYGEAGWRSSWEMLYTYGFVPGTKPDEWLAAGGRPIFFECVQRSDPLWQQKAAVIASLTGDEGNEAGMWVDVKADPAAMAATAMAPMLRLAHMGADCPEWGAALESWQVQPQQLWQALQKPLPGAAGATIEQRVAAQVRAECEAALAGLPPPDALAGALKPGASDARAALSARVLLSERHALEGCAERWKV